MADDAVVSMKKADIIRALIQAEVKHIRTYKEGMAHVLMNFHGENFDKLFELVENMADAGSPDAQHILRDFHESLMEFLG